MATRAAPSLLALLLLSACAPTEQGISPCDAGLPGTVFQSPGRSVAVIGSSIAESAALAERVAPELGPRFEVRALECSVAHLEEARQLALARGAQLLVWSSPGGHPGAVVELVIGAPLVLEMEQWAWQARGEQLDLMRFELAADQEEAIPGLLHGFDHWLADEPLDAGFRYARLLSELPLSWAGNPTDGLTSEAPLSWKLLRAMALAQRAAGQPFEPDCRAEPGCALRARWERLRRARMPELLAPLAGELADAGMQGAAALALAEARDGARDRSDLDGALGLALDLSGWLESGPPDGTPPSPAWQLAHAHALLALGEIELARGETDPAVISLLSAEALLEELGRAGSQLLALEQLALAHQQLVDGGGLIETLERKLALHHELGHLEASARARRRLALLHATLGNARTGIELLLAGAERERSRDREAEAFGDLKLALLASVTSAERPAIDDILDVAEELGWPPVEFVLESARTFAEEHPGGAVAAYQLAADELLEPGDERHLRALAGVRRVGWTEGHDAPRGVVITEAAPDRGDGLGIGDILLSYDGTPLTRPDDLFQAIKNCGCEEARLGALTAEGLRWLSVPGGPLGLGVLDF